MSVRSPPDLHEVAGRLAWGKGMTKAEAIDAIMDAAIAVFAQWGFEGASLRAIASAAHVPLSTIDNYFGSKKRLYRSLMRMVWAEVARDRRIALEAQKEKADPHPPSLEQVIEALAQPIIARAMSDDPAIRDRLYFLQQRYREHRALNDPDDVDAVDEQVRPLIDAFVASSPGLAFDDAVWAFSYCVGVMYSMQLMDRRYDALLDGAPLPSEEQVLADVVAFCHAGVEAMLALRTDRRPAP